MKPPLRAGFESAKPGSVEMDERGSCSPNQNSNFHPTLQRTHRFVPLNKIQTPIFNFNDPNALIKCPVKY